MLGQGLRVLRATGGDPGGGCRGGTRQYSLSLPPPGRSSQAPLQTPEARFEQQPLYGPLFWTL